MQPFAASTTPNEAVASPDLGTRNSPSPSVSTSTHPSCGVDYWRNAMSGQHEDGMVGKEAAGGEIDGESAHTSSEFGRIGEQSRSGDSVRTVQQGAEEEGNGQANLVETPVGTSTFCTAGDDVPLASSSSTALDVAPSYSSSSSSSRHSYGDFSSASSTTSSSASTSGFSSHSASSATTVSSTSTFSAPCPPPLSAAPAPLPLHSLAALTAEESKSGADTPSADSCDTLHPFPDPSSVPPAPPVDFTPPLLPHSAASTRPASPSTASVSSTAFTDASGGPIDETALIPPDNFAEVSPGLYRSSFPRAKNFAFLRTLGLKSVMVLVPEPYPEENVEFIKEEGIQFFQFGIPGNKEPVVSIPEEKLIAAMAVALDSRNLPLLIHCNKGKHRTGCVVGCLRRLQGLPLVSVLEEYKRHSHPKSREGDLMCIEEFAGLTKVWDAAEKEFLPTWASDPPEAPPPIQSE
ncbi:hypothetical protein JCM8547_004307 [Rhodosporidiobolus lusitaniae]